MNSPRCSQALRASTPRDDRLMMTLGDRVFSYFPLMMTAAAFTALGRTQELGAGEMLFLPGGEEHAVKGIEDASVLVTILLHQKHSG